MRPRPTDGNNDPDGPFDGNTDDPRPAGATPDADILMLQTEMLRCYIVASNSLVSKNLKQDTAFVHNLDTVDSPQLLTGIRDVPSEATFWTIQILASYEGDVNKDYDGEETGLIGIALRQKQQYPEIGCVIYLETIRDVANSVQGALLPTILEQRTVLHEVLHKYGLEHPEVAGTADIMDATTNTTGGTLANRLKLKQMSAVRSRVEPRLY